MSHLSCPLCGKHAPLSSFDPLSLDNDLTLVSFRGLGRGGGFEVSERISVLGDDVYSPIVAERVCDLCKMFIEHGVITPNYLNMKLGTSLTPLSDIAQPVETLQLIANQNNLKSRLNSQNTELELLAQLDREKGKKLNDQERLDKIIASVFRHCIFEIKFDSDKDWYVSVKILHDLTFDLLLDTIEKFDNNMAELMFHKVRPGSYDTELFFRLLKMKLNMKTHPDLLPEVDWGTAKKWANIGLIEITPIE